MFVTMKLSARDINVGKCFKENLQKLVHVYMIVLKIRDLAQISPLILSEYN